MHGQKNIKFHVCWTLYSQPTEVVFEGRLGMEVLTLASCNLVVCGAF